MFDGCVKAATASSIIKTSQRRWWSVKKKIVEISDKTWPSLTCCSSKRSQSWFSSTVNIVKFTTSKSDELCVIKRDICDIKCDICFYA